MIAYQFQRISLTTGLANLIVLPAQPAVMVLGGLAVLLGLISPPLGQAAAYLAWPFTAYTIRAVELLAGLPGGALALGRVEPAWIAIYYVVLISLALAGPRLREWYLARSGGRADVPVAVPVVATAVLGILAVFAWRSALAAPDGRLHLTVLDVGTGDAILVQTPSGRNLRIDGGESPSLLSDALGRRLPIGRRRLDWLVVAATGEGQVGALPRVIERFPPGNVLWAGPAEGRSARYLREALAEVEIPITVAQAGQALDLGDGAGLRVLAVGKRGMILLCEWRSFRALIPIGIEFDTLEALQKDPQLGEVTALLLAESGYSPANPPDLIARLRPQVVLLSVAAGDRQELPSPETLEAIQGYSTLRTDQNGWIELSTDGDQMWVEVER